MKYIYYLGIHAEHHSAGFEYHLEGEPVFLAPGTSIELPSKDGWFDCVEVSWIQFAPNENQMTVFLRFAGNDDWSFSDKEFEQSNWKEIFLDHGWIQVDMTLNSMVTFRKGK